VTSGFLASCKISL